MVLLLRKDVDKRRAADEGRAPEDKLIYSAEDAEVMDQSGRLPGGVSLAASQTWGSSPWSEVGTVRHTWDLVKKRYADTPEVLAAFEAWARETPIQDLSGTVLDWLQAESARGFFGGGGQAGRKVSEIAAENTALRAARPKAHKEPLSEKLQIATSGTHAENLKQAALLADLAHDSKGIEPAVMNAEAAGREGQYRQKSGIFPAQIAVHKDTPHPLNVGLHEIGHHVRRGLDPERVAEVVRMLKRTPEAEMIKSMPLTSKDRTYFLDDSELFSRAYAQFVAESSGHGAALGELEAIAGSASYWLQFDQSKEWTAAKKLVNLLLRDMSLK